jgi:DNA-binding NtrC family response regulator
VRSGLTVLQVHPNWYSGTSDLDLGSILETVSRHSHNHPQFTSSKPRGSAKPRILIACDDLATAELLRIIFLASNFNSQPAKDFEDACKCARSGRFQVVFTASTLGDRSWRQLFEFAKSCDPAIAFVVMARSFDLQDWGESLRMGAFDVLNLMREIPNVAKVASQAFSFATARALQSCLPQAEAQSQSHRRT